MSFFQCIAGCFHPFLWLHLLSGTGSVFLVWFLFISAFLVLLNSLCVSVCLGLILSSTLLLVFFIFLYRSLSSPCCFLLSAYVALFFLLIAYSAFLPLLPPLPPSPPPFTVSYPHSISFCFYLQLSLSTCVSLCPSLFLTHSILICLSLSLFPAHPPLSKLKTHDRMEELTLSPPPACSQLSVKMT